MKLLLDTHVLLLLLDGSTRRISKRARTALLAEDASAVVSAASVWEISIKRSLGKLQAPLNLLKHVESAGLELLPITARHADSVAALEHHHGDPFDRMLIAQAKAEKLTVVSADKNFAEYGVSLLW